MSEFNIEFKDLVGSLEFKNVHVVNIHLSNAHLLFYFSTTILLSFILSSTIHPFVYPQSHSPTHSPPPTKGDQRCGHKIKSVLGREQGSWQRDQCGPTGRQTELCGGGKGEDWSGRQFWCCCGDGGRWQCRHHQSARRSLFTLTLTSLHSFNLSLVKSLNIILIYLTFCNLYLSSDLSSNFNLFIIMKSLKRPCKAGDPFLVDY